jgi:hypothetical protein
MSKSTGFEDRVRREAYRLWEEAGRPHGRDAEFWHQASALVEREAAASAEAAAPPPKPRKKAAKPAAKPAPKAAPPPRKSKKAASQPTNSSVS